MVKRPVSNTIKELHRISSNDSGQSSGTPTIRDIGSGTVSENVLNYCSLGWKGCVVVMIKSQMGIGLMCISSTFAELGLGPGAICMIVVASITTWSGHNVGVSVRHLSGPYGIYEACAPVFGKTGAEIIGAIYCLFCMIVAAAAIVLFSTGLNTLSSHATCTAVYVAITAVAMLVLASVQTLRRFSLLVWLGILAILAAVFTKTIAAGVQGRPAAAPQNVPWVSDWKAFGIPTFIQVIAALSTYVFAYAGTPAFFSISSELRDLRTYNRSLFTCQIALTAIYLTCGIVNSYFLGSYVDPSTLGSANDRVGMAVVILALPGIMVSGALYAHLPAKYIFLRILGNSRHLHRNSVTHWAVWLSCTFGVVLFSYILASAIPAFGDIITLAGALCGTFLCFNLSACLWFHHNWRAGRANPTRTWYAEACLAAFVFLAGSVLMIAGTYVSIVKIKSTYKETSGSAAWSCADNSISA